MWLEIHTPEMPELEEMVEPLAAKIHPLGIAVLTVVRQTILSVHDRYCSSTIEMPSSMKPITSEKSPTRAEWPIATVYSEGSLEGTQPSTSTSSSSNAPVRTDLQMAELSPRRDVDPLQGTPEDPSNDTLGDRSNDTLEQSQDNTSLLAGGGGKQRESEPSPDSSSTGIRIPFIGILTLEDQSGIKQSREILFLLELEPATGTGRQKRTATCVRVDSMQLVLEAPDVPGATFSRIPHLRPIYFRLDVRPGNPTPDCVLVDQVPTEQSFRTSASNTKETSYIIKPQIGASPSLGLEISRTTGETIEKIPFCSNNRCQAWQALDWQTWWISHLGVSVPSFTVISKLDYNP